MRKHHPAEPFCSSPPAHNPPDGFVPRARFVPSSPKMRELKARHEAQQSAGSFATLTPDEEISALAV